MLPIKRVVLFKHGVGFFQRSGTVDGDQLIELGFKADQMNDVLKSLTTLDYGGGNFAALSYDSEEPLERRLGELNMRIPEKGAISAFLDQIKGARVSLPRAEGELEGAVMGIEEVERIVDGEKVKDTHLAVLAEDHRMVRVPLLEVETLRFMDENIRRDLETLLDILFSGLRKDRKSLTIQTKGAGTREVALNYVVEAPVWKTSYRIMLTGEAKGKPLLQGWALVDNTTEDDWQGVSLSLVSGLPISFIHDLYTPRYRRRPIVEVEEEAAVAPPIVENAMLMEAEAAYDEEMDDIGAARMKMAKRAPMPAAAPPMGEAARSSVEVQTRTQEVGDLFAYEIIQPVDIARSRSALVPIVQTEVDVERVALYNAEIREKNPMTAFRLKNSTDLTLEGGPVTVFEGESYVGEAMLDTMRKDEERITPYSVELGIQVKHEQHYQRESYTRARKSGSYIYKYYRQLVVTEYVFASRLDRKVTVYLDHPFQYNVREDTPEPAEITESFWRFKLDAAAKKNTEFAVKEVSEEYESVEIPSIARTSILQMVKEKLISKKTQGELEKIADKVQGIRRIEEEIAKKEREEAKIDHGQKRLRDNLKALGGSTEENKLRQKYVASLSREEERIEQLRGEAAELRDRLEREREELDEMVDTLQLA